MSLAKNAHTAGGVRHQYHVVLILSHGRCTTLAHHASYLKQHLVHQNIAPDRVGLAKQSFSGALAQNRHRRVLTFSSLIKKAALRYRPLTHCRELPRGGIYLCLMISIVVTQSLAAGELRNRCDNIW